MDNATDIYSSQPKQVTHADLVVEAGEYGFSDGRFNCVYRNLSLRLDCTCRECRNAYSAGFKSGQALRTASQ